MISRTNNFDFLRLIFASLVIITHSYALSGATVYDPLARLTQGQMEFSYLGVHGFFIISGYLRSPMMQTKRQLTALEYKTKLRRKPLCKIFTDAEKDMTEDDKEA